MMQSTSLKAKATELKRDHILEAAIRIFAERGFQRATIHDIAVEAGVADGTIYTAFKNKTDSALIPEVVAATARSGAYVTPNLSTFEAISRQWGKPEVVASWLSYNY